MTIVRIQPSSAARQPPHSIPNPTQLSHDMAFLVLHETSTPAVSPPGSSSPSSSSPRPFTNIDPSSPTPCADNLHIIRQSVREITSNLTPLLSEPSQIIQDAEMVSNKRRNRMMQDLIACGIEMPRWRGLNLHGGEIEVEEVNGKLKGLRDTIIGALQEYERVLEETEGKVRVREQGTRVEV